MQTEEKTHILSQLKSLRQQSLSQYLGTNLQSLANRQVIEDILTKFISIHQDEFLTTISNNIAEIKEQYRNIKKLLKDKEEQQNLLRLKLENQISSKYEQQMEQFFQKWLLLEQLSFQKVAQKNPSKAINKLFAELSEQKRKNEQEKDRQNTLQKQLQCKKKQLQSKQNQISTLCQEMRILENRLNLVNQRNDSKDLLNKSLEEQIYQKHIKAEQTMILVKEMEAKLLSSKEMMTFLQDKACAIKQDNVKLKHQIDLIAKQKENIQLLFDSSQKQNERFRHERILVLENEKTILDKLQFSQKNLERQLTQKSELIRQLSQLQGQRESLLNKIRQSESLSSSLRKKKQQLYQKITHLQNQLTQNEASLSQSTQTSETLTKQLLQKEQTMKDYVDKKDEQIKAIEEQLKLLKEEADQKEEQEKQYEMYLEQIVQLRQKIKSLTPGKYELQIDTDCLGRPVKIKNKRTKIYFLLTQVQNKFIQLKSQRSQITKLLAVQINQMKEYMNKAISMILNKSIETKLKCDYCQHSKSYEASLMQRVSNTGIAKNVAQNSVRKNSNFVSDKIYMEKNIHSFKKPSDDQLNEFNQVTYFQGQINLAEQCNQMQKTRQFSYKPSGISNQNPQKGSQWLDVTQSKPAGSRGMMRSLRSLNQKMKVINQENSMYQVHLSRILSQQNFQ